MDTLQGLTQLNQVPVDMTLEGLRAVGQRQRTDEITLQELARKQQYEQQADPLRIRQMQLANDVSLQNLGRVTRENKEGDFTSDARMQAELKKHLLSASQADLDQVAQHGQRLAYSMHQDPTTRAKERAMGQALLLQSKEAIQEREKIRLQGQNAMALQADAIRAGRFSHAPQRDTNSLTVKLRGSKSAAQTAEILDQAYAEAFAAGDMEGAKEIASRAIAARQRAAEDARNRGLATPGMDIGTQAGVAMNPPPQARAPVAGGAASVAPGGPSQADLEFTAKKHGLTVEQVKAKLGIK